MRLAKLGTISTSIVIVLSIALVVPAFTQKHEQLLQKVMLSFSVVDDRRNLPTWCSDLATVFDKHATKAIVFVSGKVADEFPECVSAFSDDAGIDIGSQTYNYVDLTTIPDYESALDEVRNGKLAVDRAGKIDSKLFKAPYGSTDENIYSLLYRSGILGDFSYKEQYNRYYNEQFVKYDLTSYEWSPQLADFLISIPVSDVPIMVNFDNSVPVEQIDNFVEKISADNDLKLVNASDLFDVNLTVRRLSS